MNWRQVSDTLRTIGMGWAVLLASVELGSAAPPDMLTPEQIEFFEKQVRPVLAEQCWGCHGEKKQEAGLRLDSRAAVLRGGDEGPIVLPGNPKDSTLLRAVRRVGEIKMPPDRALPAGAVDALERWVQLGAPWPVEKPAANSTSLAEAARSHWAFQPLRVAPTPTVQTRDWSRSTLDRFVLSRLESQKLAPSPPAERRALIRRLTFDLLGLPPAPEEVEEFVADESPDAYERLVDRRLASPRLGERWGRHWLDLARYADNKGYVFFEEKTYPWAYTYRDYVVESMNRDLPYDRFIVEQIAADQLELGEDRRPLRALGLLTLGAHFMNNTHDIVDDRIDVITRGLMGLTATCARCHDHKYDPIPQADYYALYGVFRSCEEPMVPPQFAPPPDTEEYKKYAAELEKREKALRDFVERKHRDLVEGARRRVGEYLIAAYTQRHQPATDDFMLIADPNDLNPTMVLRWRVYLEKAAKQPHAIWSPWHRFAALDEGRFAQDAAVVLQELTSGAAALAHVNPLVRQALTRKPPQAMGDVAAAYAELLTTIEKKWQEARQAAETEKRPAPVSLADPLEEELRRVFYGADAPPDVPVLLGWGFLTLLPDRAAQGEYQKLLKEVEAWLMSGPGAPPRAHVLLDSAQPFEPRVFLRGNPNRLGDATPRQFLAVANSRRQPFTRGSGRLEMAQAVVASTNPLTPRVLVNRWWMHHFGAPLVKTPGDFGLRGEPPTHPELIDYLAARLITNDWSLKQLHREIVTSASYRQSSLDRPDAMRVDPENRWLWRMNSRRLDFETLRDSLLLVADSLDLKIGGPPVQLLGEAIVPRRTLYGFVDRMDVAPLLTTFDFPNPNQSNPQRDQTTVAPQALYLMNNNFVAEIAARLNGRRELSAPPQVDERLTQLYRLVLGRAPSERERSRLHTLLGPQPDAEAWRRLAHALLMLNEFVFID